MLDFSSNLNAKKAQEWYKLVLNILGMTYFVTASITVLEAAIQE